MRFLRTILSVLYNIRAIFRRDDCFTASARLLLTFLRLSAKYLLLVDLLHMNPEYESFFGYRIRVVDYSTFYSLFVSIFIEDEYSFKPDNKAPLIIDCGSNIGMSVIYFKMNYPDSKIICFEPHAETFRILEENIKANNLKDVGLNNAAVFDREGMISLFSDADRFNVTGMSVTKRLMEKGRRLREDEVKSVLLSNYIEAPVDLLKIDVEGAEAAVFDELAARSMLGLIKEIIAEYHYNQKTNQDNKLGRLVNILERENFKYVIHDYLRPPFYKHKDKPYNLIIYAYK